MPAPCSVPAKYFNLSLARIGGENQMKVGAFISRSVGDDEKPSNKKRFFPNFSYFKSTVLSARANFIRSASLSADKLGVVYRHHPNS